MTYQFTMSENLVMISSFDIYNSNHGYIQQCICIYFHSTALKRTNTVVINLNINFSNKDYERQSNHFNINQFMIELRDVSSNFNKFRLHKQ